jgi:glycosyltransferase involved in cell wall biosynthesis
VTGVKLVASLIVRNELRRYLKPCIQHLGEFCDEIAIVDDASDDGTTQALTINANWIPHGVPIRLLPFEHPIFYAHEGNARQRLIDFTLETGASHVLSIDADEFISDGAQLRERIEADPNQPVWSLNMEEIWTANQHLYSREDGGWRSHPLPFVWKAPPAGQRWTMRDRKLACGRVPTQVMQHGARAKTSGVSILHFGWADPATRKQRYDRYTLHDGGKFHASAHLKSIMWPAARIRLRQRPWPEGAVFDGLRERFKVAV